MKRLTVVLAGNPNCGKSTIFNGLTGGQQHVGNWPGKTISRKEGMFVSGDTQVTVLDLPGTYSLSAYSPEEQIARDFIVEEKPDLVVNVVDAANLERNLYLTAQILETGAPLLLVLNMCDMAVKRGYQIDNAALAARLGDVPLILAVASRGEGLAELREAIVASAQGESGEEDSPNRRGKWNGASRSHAGDAPRLWGCH